MDGNQRESGSNPVLAHRFCTWEAKLFDRHSSLGVKAKENVHCSEKLLEGLTQGAWSLVSCCWSVEDLIKVDCVQAGGCSGAGLALRGEDGLGEGSGWVHGAGGAQSTQLWLRGSITWCQRSRTKAADRQYC